MNKTRKERVLVGADAEPYSEWQRLLWQVRGEKPVMQKELTRLIKADIRKLQKKN